MLNKRWINVDLSCWCIVCVFFQAAKKLMAATGRHCLPLTVDVRQPQTISAAVDETLKELGRIDILINSM